MTTEQQIPAYIFIEPDPIVRAPGALRPIPRPAAAKPTAIASDDEIRDYIKRLRNGHLRPEAAHVPGGPDRTAEEIAMELSNYLNMRADPWNRTRRLTADEYRAARSRT